MYYNLVSFGSDLICFNILLFFLKANDFHLRVKMFSLNVYFNQFNTIIGMLFAAEELDYEQQKFHQLMIRATDSVTGVYAEVEVSISVDDINDCPPEFSSDSYHVSISEAAPSSTLLMKLDARDNDTGLNIDKLSNQTIIFLSYFCRFVGINQEILYSISPNSSNASLYFHVDASDGNIYLKQSLDRETVSTHHFTVIATDKGVPSLSSTAHVWVTGTINLL